MRFVGILVMLLSSTISANSFAEEKKFEYRMMPIKGGVMTMRTCPEDKPICPYHEFVEREVSVKSFEIGEFEVPFALYDHCVKTGGCQSEVSDWAYKNRKVRAPCIEDEACHYPFDEHWGRNWRPVINVSWLDANLYVAWLNETTGGNYRLPTTHEWEYAARANIDTTYPWGDKVGNGTTNCKDCGSPWSGSQTLEIGRFSPNQFGLYDMNGNISEWTSNCVPIRAENSKQCAEYIHRGGAWTWPKSDINPGTAMNSMRDTKRGRHVGFRLARDTQ